MAQSDSAFWRKKEVCGLGQLISWVALFTNPMDEEGDSIASGSEWWKATQPSCWLWFTKRAYQLWADISEGRLAFGYEDFTAVHTPPTIKNDLYYWNFLGKINIIVEHLKLPISSWK